MLHVGDITKLNGNELPPVDIITGGSPCQDLSVAGARAGLAGERSGLFMEQVRIVKEMRDADERRGRAAHAVRPRYMVWENVPGASVPREAKTSGLSWRKLSELKLVPVQCLDLTPGVGICWGNHTGRSILTGLASYGRSILGCRPAPQKNLPCRRFCRAKCPTNII